jgi:two-component system response regulator PilR (NtrC family)
MESEFFGHRKGSFTGAVTDKDGLFKAADGGTLFLDEVGDLPLSMQVKLLRAIQEKSIRPVGSQSEIKVDVRILSATHKGLQDLVAQGKFRQDLYYRLNVIELRMPPLRDCREDIEGMAREILRRLGEQDGAKAGAAAPRLSAAALEQLQAYDFPGNVRELENILERAIALSAGGEIGIDDLRLHPAGAEEGATDAGLPAGPLPAYLDKVERDAILAALAKTGFNRTAAAKLLGLTFRTLRYRMQRLGIKDPESDGR